jgi:hypothetical protein
MEILMAFLVPQSFEIWAGVVRNDVLWGIVGFSLWFVVWVYSFEI